MGTEPIDILLKLLEERSVESGKRAALPMNGFTVVVAVAMAALIRADTKDGSVKSGIELDD